MTTKNRMLIAVMILGMLPGCADFPTSFERIESQRIRVLDFIYEPAEAAPGDSVTLLAVFAGDTVLPGDVFWQVSYTLSGNSFNLEVADSVVPLGYTPVDTVFSPNTFAVALRFRIPEDVMEKSPMIPQNWTSAIPREFQPFVPAGILAMSKKEFLDTVESMIGQPVEPDMAFYLPLIMELLTVKIRLFANVKGVLPVRSDYTVRYNTRFADIPRVNINRNPVIRRVGVYKVTGANLLSLNVTSDTWEYFRLYGHDEDSVSDTISVEKGYTYFVAAQSDIFDTVYSVLAFVSPQYKDTLETHFYGWFYRFDGEETGDVDPYDLMSITVMTGGANEILYPPKDTRVKNFTLWSQVYDYNLTERYRPDASSLQEVRGVFKYE